MLFLELYYNHKRVSLEEMYEKAMSKSRRKAGLLHRFSYGFCDIILSKEDATMKPDIEELRKKYIENPPEGMTSRDIRHMSEEELLDMDYFSK